MGKKKNKGNEATDASPGQIQFKLRAPMLPNEIAKKLGIEFSGLMLIASVRGGSRRLIGLINKDCQSFKLCQPGDDQPEDINRLLKMAIIPKAKEFAAKVKD